MNQKQKKKEETKLNVRTGIKAGLTMNEILEQAGYSSNSGTTPTPANNIPKP